MTFCDEMIGAGPPVVFFPGAGWSGRAGLIIAETLQASHQVALVDLPGYGRNQGLSEPTTDQAFADWVGAYLDSRDWAQAHLIGHSLGGYLALLFAAHYPERVATLSLLDVGHRRLPRFRSQPGLFGYAVPFLSLYERIVGVQRLWRLRGYLEDPDDGNRSLEARMAAFRESGTYPLATDDILNQAMGVEPKLALEGLSLLFALYRANPPRLLEEPIQVPTLLVYSIQPAESERQKTVSAVRRLTMRNSHLKALGVSGGHHVHWAGPSVVPAVASHIRSGGHARV